MRKSILFFGFLLMIFPLSAQTRWHLKDDGGISWEVKKGEVHTDNIEMSGRFISAIVTYGVDDKGKLVMNRQLVFPMLRTIPNNTQASLIYSFGKESSPVIKINNREVTEQVTKYTLKGLIVAEGDWNNGVNFTRKMYPSVDKPMAFEKFTIFNNSKKDVSIDVENFEKISHTHAEKSFYGVYELAAKITGAGIFNLRPGDSINFSVAYSARKISETLPEANADQELAKRLALIKQISGNLIFHSPDSILNRMFEFAKIRAMESIFETKGGLVHSPGGGAYYAAIWANDQAEYANPFFAYTGYNTAIEAGKTAWNWFAKYMNPDYKPIPSSIIAEGTGNWHGAGDRGDMAMIAYGASRFALALGDRKTAEEVWPLIEWCIEYCKRKMTPEGVIASDSDELERRFPAGKANLCTSSLYYDALRSASFLARDLGKPASVVNNYRKMAADLKISIEKYFGAEMDGFHTYRYYDGNDILRSWICIPLTTGIFDRAAGTTDALFSPNLWTDQGLLTQAGTSTFWDRSTLYGFRGVIAAGAVDRAMPYLESYSTRRLLGEHVPYAVEAWPEGNQRHLSAESALYCRVITEGLFGFRPDGLNSFTLTPQLPSGWNEMSLKNIIAFGGKKIDVDITRAGKNIRVHVTSDKFAREFLIGNGKTVELKLRAD